MILLASQLLGLGLGCSENAQQTYEYTHMVKPLKAWTVGKEFYVLASGVDCSYCYVAKDGVGYRPERSVLYTRHSADGSSWESLGKSESLYGEDAALASDGSILIAGYKRGSRIEDASTQAFTYDWDPGLNRADGASSGFNVLTSLVLQSTELFRWCTTVAIDKSGTVYAGCRASLYDWSTRVSTDQWLTFRKSSGESKLSQVDRVEFVNSIANNFAIPNASIVTSAGSVLVGGNSNLSAVVRRTPDGGATWSTVDQIDPSGNLGFSEVKGFFQKKNGVLLSIVKAYRSNYQFTQSYIPYKGSAYYTVLRASSDDGATWSELATGYAGTVFPEQFLGSDLAEDSAGNLYFAGAIFTTQGSNEGAKWGDNNRYLKWTVLKSADAGVTWSLVDQVSTFKANGASRIAINEDGNIVVAGTKKDEYLGDRHNCHVHLRGSLDGGKTWKVLDSDPGPSF